MAYFHKQAELVFIAEYPSENSSGPFREQLESINLEGLNLVSAGGVSFDYQSVGFGSSLISLKIIDVFEQFGAGRFGDKVFLRVTITSKTPIENERPTDFIYKTVASINSQLVGTKLVDYVDFLTVERSFSGRVAAFSQGFYSLAKKRNLWLFLFGLAFVILALGL